MIRKDLDQTAKESELLVRFTRLEQNSTMSLDQRDLLVYLVLPGNLAPRALLVNEVHQE